MRYWLAIILVLAMAAWAPAATISAWNGITLGSSSGNISKWNGTTVGTSTGNIGQINGMTSPSAGSPPVPTDKRLLQNTTDDRLFEDNVDLRYLEK